MFRAAKDAMASEAARRYANNVIARYGIVTDLKIDSARKTVHAVCQLEGELEPVTVDVLNYEVQQSGERRFVKLGACRCSRPWIERLLEDHAKGREVEVPSWAAAAL